MEDLLVCFLKSLRITFDIPWLNDVITDSCYNGIAQCQVGAVVGFDSSGSFKNDWSFEANFKSKWSSFTIGKYREALVLFFNTLPL